jgi:hypothetical protein
VFASQSLFFSSFDHGNFGEVATVVYALYVLFFELKPEPNRVDLLLYLC